MSATAVGHCSHAETAFIITSLGIEIGAADKNVLKVIILTSFILNLISPLLLKGCAILINRHTKL